MVHTNDIEASTDGDGGVCVQLTNVLAGVRLLNIPKMEVVSVTVVMLKRYAIILGDDIGVNG